MSQIRKAILIRLAITVIAIVIITSAAIAGYLLYKGELSGDRLSDGFFFAAIAYLVLAVIPLYEVLTSSNTVSITFGEFAIKGKIDNQSRVDDILARKNYRFSILMVITSIILFINASIAARIL